MPNRTELTNKLQRVRGMVEYVRENLDGDEYEAFLDMVAPLPEPQTTTKKPTQKKSARKSSSKSPRANGMAAQLKSRTDEQRQAITNRIDADDDNQQRCTVLRDDDKPCGLLPDHNVHHMKSARGYHPFESSGDAQSAVEKSSVNGGAGSITPNSVDGTDDASSAVRAAAGE